MNLKTVIAIAAALGLAGCGGANLPKGAKAKDAGDIQKICTESWESIADGVGRNSRAGKYYLSTAKPCCREVGKAAKKLSKAQQTYLWYEYAVEDDLRRTEREIEKLLEIDEEIAANMTREEQMEALAARGTFNVCLQKMEKKG